MSKRLSQKGAALLTIFEGFEPNWYLDAVDVPTIGIGFTWRSAAFRRWWTSNRRGQPFARGASMTLAEAEAVLPLIVAEEYGAAVNRILPANAPQHVFDGAVSPVFNLGPGSLKWKWGQALARGDYAEAARRLVTTGTTAKGRKLRGLVIRRQEEAELLGQGDYVFDPGRTPVDAHADSLADGILERGERGKAVSAWQTAMQRAGHYGGKIDGIFGHGTEAATLAFQEKRGIARDGKVGPQTLQASIDAERERKAQRQAQADAAAKKRALERVAKADPETVEQALRDANSTTIEATDTVKETSWLGKVTTLVTGIGATGLYALEQVGNAIVRIPTPVLVLILVLAAIGFFLFWRSGVFAAKAATARVKEAQSGDNTSRLDRIEKLLKARAEQGVTA